MKRQIAFPVLIASLAVLTAACGGGRGPGGARGGPGAGEFGGGPVGVTQPSTLLAQARDYQARGGCAKAAPVYRIVSSYGDGYDVAQYELAACLLEMEGDSSEETALFRQEAIFWLTRAAWAGNARAQGRLAEVYSGAPAYMASGVAPDTVSAQMWSMVYEANGVREVYGLRDLPPMVAEHIARGLKPEGLAEARARAAAYRKISMASFVPTAREQGEGGDRAGRQGPQGGGGPGGPGGGRPPRQ